MQINSISTETLQNLNLKTKSVTSPIESAKIHQKDMLLLLQIYGVKMQKVYHLFMVHLSRILDEFQITL